MAASQSSKSQLSFFFWTLKGTEKLESGKENLMDVSITLQMKCTEHAHLHDNVLSCPEWRSSRAERKTGARPIKQTRQFSASQSAPELKL